MAMCNAKIAQNCWHDLTFIQYCVTVDTVCALLATAERYIQYKCTKFLIQKVFNYFNFKVPGFVDDQ